MKKKIILSIAIIIVLILCVICWNFFSGLFAGVIITVYVFGWIGRKAEKQIAAQQTEFFQNVLRQKGGERL